MSATNGDLRLDGNAAAGVLQEVFRFEMSTARLICAGCGAEGALGALLAWVTPMGAVVRCPACDQAILRVVHGGGRWWLDVRGAVSLCIAEAG